MTVTVYKAGQAAQAVQCSRQLLDAACLSGALRAADLGTTDKRHNWRIFEEDLIQWVRDGCPVLPKT